ncbi:conserved repeat domain-containing protein, partial [Flavobacterium sp. ov086]
MRNFTFNQPKFFRLTLLIAFLLLVSYNASAQFYTKHYIAPAPWQYFSKANEIVIATNSTATVNITLSKSDGTLEANLTAIKGTPAVYRFKLNASTLPMNALTTVLNAAGLIITSTAPTSINLRNVASDDYSRGENADVNIKGNAALTSFGDAGLGVRFRVGYYRDGSLGSFSTFGDQRPIYSIMATVNNTSIKISNNVVTTLNAGQSYLFKAPIGTLVESSNPCVMNTSAAIDMPGGCGDGAFNQIPPEAVLGTEYFLERGTGNSIAEQTTVVATKDNTVVTVTGYTATGTLVTTNTVTLALAGDFYTFVNGSNGTSFTASRVVADKRVAVYSGTAQKCEVDVSTIAPVSECGGSNFIETAKFRDYASNTLDYFGYILLRSATDIVYVNGVSIESISGIAPRYQIGTTGWYLINFKNTQIGGPDFLSISSIAKLTVSIVQQDGGFSMAGFFSNFAAQPEDPTLTYISGGGCTNNKAELTTPAGFAPYQWYFNGTAITGANSSTYTATKTGSYSVSSTLACGAQTPSKPVSVTLCTDLGITKTVDNTTPCIGSNVEFTVKVSNLGGNNVSGISVNDLLPSGYTYVSSTPSVGAYDSGTGVWSIGDVDAGAVLTLKIIATVNSSGNYTNTASLPASVDTNTANNSASAAVNPKAPYLTVTNPAAVCATATIDLTAAAVTAGSTGNLTLSYWVNSSATTSYTTPTTATAGTYYIKATSAEGCVFIKPVVVTNNPLPSTPEIYVSKNSATCTTAGNTTLRSTDSATNYNGSTYLWSTGETTRTITINTEGTYSLKIISGSGCASSSSAPITVTFTPTAPSASAQTFCSSENKKVSDLSPSGSTIKWYDTSSSTSPLAGTTALTSKTYYVSQTSSSGCESARTAVVVTVNSTSSAPSASPQTFCAADNKKISDLSPSGSTIKWYDTSSSTSPLAGNTALTSKTYYVSQTANSCGESARTPVVVTISTVPSAPATSPQTFCINDSKKVSDLSPSGAGIKWYSAITGGTLYDGTETLTSKAYFVSQSNSCGESARTSVTVTVNNTAAPTASSQTFCAIDNKKVSDLSPSGASFKWYNASTGGTPYTGAETLSSTNYYVSQTINGCESSRTLVAVTVNNTAAPTASSQTFCAADNKKVNDLSPSGAGIKWYNASTGGTAYLGTETLSSANYYVSQTLNSCESARTLVSVTVNPTPDAPSIIAGGSTTFCPGGSVVLTSSGGSSYLWSTGETTQAIIVSASGSYTVKVANATGCLSLASTATSVTVNPTPSAPSANAQSFCSVDNKKVSDLSPSGAGIKWYSANTGGTLYTGTEALTNGTYYVSQTTNGCESPRTSVAVTLTAKPADIVTNKTICSGESYTWSVNNTVYTTNQTALKIINNSCTADQILNLTVTPKPSDIVTNKTICSGETYTWTVNGIDYTTNQTGLRISHDGCTADEVLNLTITPKPTDVVTNKTICSGETYTWSANGIDYTSNQTGLRIPHDGCTADEVLNLTVTPKPADIVTNKTICSGETYNWLANGIDYTSNQTGLRISHDGCTADEVLNLTVTPKPSDIVTNKTICSGETYTWTVNGIDYTSNQTGLRIPHDGCTADEVLNLTVTPKPSDIVTNKTICSGENYTWSVNNTVYSTNQNGLRIPHDGCTADEVLNLTVTPKPADIVTNKTICSGETYTWSANGIDYTSNQTGLRISHDGCTADEVLNLTVTPKPSDIV